MLTNIIGGLQGIIDHVLVGHLVGFTGNAAIGVAWQIFLVVIVFITSLFTGMSVLVARFAGAGDEDKVNRTVYQAFLTAIGISLLIMAPVGYFLSPSLLDLVNAAPEVKAEALPFLRIMFLFSSGMLVFYMLGGALRSAGDARTPMILGARDDGAEHRAQRRAHPRAGPDPAFGTAGAAMGTVIASGLVCGVRARRSSGAAAGSCRSRAARAYGPDWTHHPVALPVRPADRHPGNRDEHRRRADARVHRLAGAERGGAGGVCRLVYRSSSRSSPGRRSG